jgi:hypothetical protein
MTNFFDPQPVDPYEARSRFIATLFLLSQLGVIGKTETALTRTRSSDGSRSLPSKRAARSGHRLVRPPRSC